MVLLIIATFIPVPEVTFIGFIAIWAFFAVAVIDVVVLGFLLNKKLGEKFGADKVERVRWYSAMRAWQLLAPSPSEASGQARAVPRAREARPQFRQPRFTSPRPERAAVQERRVALHEVGAGIRPFLHVCGPSRRLDRGSGRSLRVRRRG